MDSRANALSSALPLFKISGSASGYVIAAEQVEGAAHVPRERDSTSRRAVRRSPHHQPATDSADRNAQGRLRRLRRLPRAPRDGGGRRRRRRRRQHAAISEPGGRGRPPERLHRWRERAAGYWRTVSDSSGRRRRASPRWRSGRLTAMTSAVSFSSHCLSFCLSNSRNCVDSVAICDDWLYPLQHARCTDSHYQGRLTGTEPPPSQLSSPPASSFLLFLLAIYTSSSCSNFFISSGPSHSRN